MTDARTWMVLIAMLLPVAGAFGQASPAELRRQTERLQGELERARAELARVKDDLHRAELERDALSARLKHAEEENDRLRRQVGVIREPSVAPGRAPTPTDPLASPLSMLLELQKRYDQELTSIPAESPEQLARFQRAAREWCDKMPDEVRGTSEWLVSFSEAEQLSATEFRTLLTVYDERTMLPIGEPMLVVVPQRHFKRVKARPDVEHWRASLLVRGEPVFNEQRESPGIFNVPYFVGRMVEFGIGFEWRRLLPIEPSPVGDPDAAEAPELENEER